MERAVIRVLVADDHRIIRAGVRELLSVSSMPVHCLVEEAENTDQVVAMAGAGNYDVILMDYLLPSANGPRATELILRRNADACILALSSYDERSYVEQMVRAGARGYVLKDTEPETLLAAIREAMNGKRFYSNAIALQWMDKGLAPRTRELADRLTAREREVLGEILKGFKDREIAERMFVSKRTVDKHRQRVMQKLGTRNAVELTLVGTALGLG